MSAWMFIQRFPTPQLLQAAGKRQWEKFLHARHLWRTESGPRRLELFAHATELCGTVPMANAKSQLALSLISMLLALEKQLGIYRRRIEELFSRHPDHDSAGVLSDCYAGNHSHFCQSVARATPAPRLEAYATLTPSRATRWA